jgi:acyl-CoA dehydrogenase
MPVALAARARLLLAGPVNALSSVPPSTGVRRLRRATLSKGVMNGMKKLGFLPEISQTERTAIEAGTVWVEGELFSGQPDFDRMLREAYPQLTADEQAFIDGPVEELCRLADEWTTVQLRDLPREGVGLHQARAALRHDHPEGVRRARVLGAGELGRRAEAELSERRRRHHGDGAELPRAGRAPHPLRHRGPEGPLPPPARPRRGDPGVRPHRARRRLRRRGHLVLRRRLPRRGREARYLRLNWKKRYITLAAISTVLGLAFRLRDPENLLGKGTDLGITCALVPTKTKGVKLGQRHDPLGVPFYNCPTWGEDVVVPLEDSVIGGVKGAGQGWRMLMESLAAGRGISLPASATGTVKITARAASAHARVRQQFGLPIGKFEGIEEPLARIGGYLYTIEAARALHLRRDHAGGAPRPSSRRWRSTTSPSSPARPSTTGWTSSPATPSRAARRTSSPGSTRGCRSRSRSRAPTSSRARS